MRGILTGFLLIVAAVGAVAVLFSAFIVDQTHKAIVLQFGEPVHVRGTIRLRGEGGGEKVADVHELRAEMRPIDGKWLLTAVEIVEVLER